MSTKISKSSNSIHKKWQIEAEKRGGKNIKIVLVRLQAKKLIHDLLKDSFRPMNITSIYEVSSVYVRLVSYLDFGMHCKI
jgi:hypothetical protein